MIEMKVLSNEGVNKSDILIDLTQKYTFKIGGAEKTVRSLVTLQRQGDDGLITLHEEEWDHEPNKVQLFKEVLIVVCGGWIFGKDSRGEEESWRCVG
jgi:hypothetical protein